MRDYLNFRTLKSNGLKIIQRFRKQISFLIINYSESGNSDTTKHSKRTGNANTQKLK